jgi:HD-GYP domain-containing protein (c-di-GMP phosphodiesterase class II)
MQTVLSLANAVDARDEYTSDHGQVMAHMALAIGRMFSMTPLELESIQYASMLHDVGKIGVSDTILQKPAELTEKEWASMRKHSSIGEQILSPVPYLSDASMVVRHHHEHYDGSGYPDKLVAEEIPLGSRILSVVDSYCAMRDKRVYKGAMSHEEAVKELNNCSGSQFDPKIVKTFIRLMESGIINNQYRLGRHLDNDSENDTEAA